LYNSILAIDIGTTHITSIVATVDFNKRINILGVSKIKSQGVRKGNIVDINLAGGSISESVLKAISSSGAEISKAVVSVSGANTKTLRSNGSINIASGQITEKEIKQVLEMALYNANIIQDYDVIHVLPVFFRVDDGTSISNPLNMNGSRLEVSVNVITVKKTSLINIKNALKLSNIEVDKFVLTGYANALATLENDQKKLGTIVINLGGTTSQIVAYKGSTIVYNDFLPIGSEHITEDISTMIGTPYSAANMVKKQYGTLLPVSDDEDGEQSIKKVKLPLIVNENETKEISLDQIQPILHARVEETLCLIHDRLVEGSVYDTIDGGIVLTGGMTKIPGIKELARLVFAPLPVKVSNPVNIQNGYVDFNDPTLSTVAGLLIYELDSFDNFELDSNRNLKSKKIGDNVNRNSEYIHPKPVVEETIKEADIPSHDIKNIGMIDSEQEAQEKKEKSKLFSGIFNKLSRWL